MTNEPYCSHQRITTNSGAEGVGLKCNFCAGFSKDSPYLLSREWVLKSLQNWKNEGGDKEEWSSTSIAPTN